MAESTDTPLDLDLWVEQMAQLIDLPIPADYRAGVIENMARIQTIAQLVLDFPLPDDIELAPSFDP